MYQSFLTLANAKTRSQHAMGGSSVNLERYLSTMNRPDCDGDAVTLQVAPAPHTTLPPDPYPARGVACRRQPPGRQGHCSFAGVTAGSHSN